MPNSPAADIAKALRRAIKDENIPKLRELLAEPSLSYTTYNSAFSAPLEKAVTKNSREMVCLLLGAIKRRYQDDPSQDAAAVINKVLTKITQSINVEIIKQLYQCRDNLSVHRYCDQQVLQNAINWERSDIIKTVVAANQDPQFPFEKLVIESKDPEIRSQLLAALPGQHAPSFAVQQHSLAGEISPLESPSSTQEAAKKQPVKSSKSVKLRRQGRRSLKKLIEALAISSDSASNSPTSGNSSDEETSASSLVSPRPMRVGSSSGGSVGDRV